MTKILFVCHGNICRSPMAESVMAYLVKEKGIADIGVDSAATSTEEIGNGVHPGTQRVLRAHNIPLIPHRARQLTWWDRMIGVSEKVHGLLDWSPRPRDIADPWYTGDFETTFRDIWEGCTALLEALTQ